MSGTVVDALTWWVRTVPDHPAIDFDGDVVTYAELDTWSDGVACGLRDRGVAAGDRVGIVGTNTLEWCVAAVAAWKVGAVVCGFNQRFLAAELGALVQLCEPAVVFGDAAHLALLDEVAASGAVFTPVGLEPAVGALRGEDHPCVPGFDAEPEDPTAIVFTSGTTGTPKGVVFTHRTIAGIMHEWSLAEPVAPNDLRVLMVLPMFTGAGVVWGLARSLVQGGTMYLQPRFDPARALEVLQEARITTFTGPPILFEQISRVPGFERARLPHLTTAWVGGARVPVPLLEKWRPSGVALRQIYGQTEIGGTGTAMSAEGALAHPNACGWGGPFTRIRVVDADGHDCAPGEVGEIVMRGPGMFPGYWRNEEATKKALRGGWLHTGDLGTLDEEGLLTYVDRMGEMINSGGLKISPAELETVLQQAPGVAEVAVIPVPDEKFGETPAAVVHSEGELDPAALVAFCNDRLADYKVPRYVIPHEGPLPRMASGKIAKRDLRGVYADAPQRFPRVR
ncbi:class I adenylate-forming enzyme family protein [Pseudonocardia halophobica]|uniref:class I adenylate-forming enzyme family protein n=1 Tax=Pseudonocardia halophobica TaxID=29401 RepID=UPI003D9171F8